MRNKMTRWSCSRWLVTGNAWSWPTSDKQWSATCGIPVYIVRVEMVRPKRLRGREQPAGLPLCKPPIPKLAPKMSKRPEVDLIQTPPRQINLYIGRKYIWLVREKVFELYECRYSKRPLLMAYHWHFAQYTCNGCTRRHFRFEVQPECTHPHTDLKVDFYRVARVDIHRKKRLSFDFWKKN